VAAPRNDPLESVAAPQTRGQVLARYRRLRAISVQHHSNAMKLVSRDAMLRNARRLGLAQGTVLILDDIEDLNLVFDLSIQADSTRELIDAKIKNPAAGRGLKDQQSSSASTLCQERTRHFRPVIQASRGVHTLQRTWNTSLPLKWRASLTLCASLASDRR
jgi:hypothetical protein